jgi:hypothetical protein
MTELTGIFARIEADTGVTMREDFWCCQSCGHAALDGRYAFYHQQDTMSAVGSDRLYIAYSCDNDDDTATADVVAAGLREAGCEVTWDGSARQRIAIRVNGATFGTRAGDDDDDYDYEDDEDTEEE